MLQLIYWRDVSLMIVSKVQTIVTLWSSHSRPLPGPAGRVCAALRHRMATDCDGTDQSSVWNICVTD